MNKKLKGIFLMAVGTALIAGGLAANLPVQAIGEIPGGAPASTLNISR